MYAKLNLVYLGLGTQSTAQKMAEQLAPAISSQRGFKGLTFFSDEKGGEYGYLSLWETKEDLEAADKALEPLIDKAATGVVMGGPPTIRTYLVYEPKT